MRALDRPGDRRIGIAPALGAHEVAVHGAPGVAIARLAGELVEPPPADRSLRVAGETAPGRGLVPRGVEASGEPAVLALPLEQRVGRAAAGLDEAIIPQDHAATDPALGGIGQSVQKGMLVVGEAALLDPSVGTLARKREREIAGRRILVRGIAGDLPGPRQSVGRARVIGVHALARVLRAMAPPGAVLVERVHQEVRGALRRVPKRLVLGFFVGARPAEAHLSRVEDGRRLLEAEDRTLHGAALHLDLRFPVRHTPGALAVARVRGARAEVVEGLDDVARGLGIGRQPARPAVGALVLERVAARHAASGGHVLSQAQPKHGRFEMLEGRADFRRDSEPIGDGEADEIDHARERGGRAKNIQGLQEWSRGAGDYSGPAGQRHSAGSEPDRWRIATVKEAPRALTEWESDASLRAMTTRARAARLFVTGIP